VRFDGKKCIRCDESVSGERPECDFRVVPMKQETEFYVIHDECYEEIKDRRVR